MIQPPELLCAIETLTDNIDFTVRVYNELPASTVHAGNSARTGTLFFDPQLTKNGQYLTAQLSAHANYQIVGKELLHYEWENSLLENGYESTIRERLEGFEGIILSLERLIIRTHVGLVKTSKKAFEHRGRTLAARYRCYNHSHGIINKGIEVMADTAAAELVKTAKESRDITLNLVRVAERRLGIWQRTKDLLYG